LTNGHKWGLDGSPLLSRIVEPTLAQGIFNSKRFLARIATFLLSLLIERPVRGRVKAFMRNFAERQRGATLAEMMVAVSIFGAVTALSVPHLMDVLAGMRLREGMLAITSGLRLARLEAIRRNGRVVICKSGDGKQCSDSGDWSQGWIIYHDVNNSRKVDGDEAVLYREASISSRLRLSGNQMIARDLAYSFSGEAVLPNGGFQAGTFTIAPRDGIVSTVYCVAVSKRGSHRVYKSSNGICVS
jgi:type IV fimbrial biogenesis protein FimT